jgi:CheY-like chemotaxis protein
MNHLGDIIVIDDDFDDLEIFEQAVKSLKLPNAVRTFTGGLKFLEYVRKTEIPIFFIVCDIYMPGMDGFDLRRTLLSDPELRAKTFPFLFISSRLEQQGIKADELAGQGHFEKPSSFEDMKYLIQVMVNFWSHAAI